MTKNKPGLQNKLTAFYKKEKLVVIFLIALFFLRFPTLFEPLKNNSESFYFLFSKNLLSLSFFPYLELLTTFFAKIVVVLFGNTLWSIKFSLTLWLLINFSFFYFLAKNIFSPKILFLLIFILFLIFSIPSEIGFSLSLFSLLFLPLVNLILIIIKLVKFNFIYLEKVFLLVFIFLFTSFFIFGKTNLTFSYYQNFGHYFWSKVTNDRRAEESYFASFGSDVSSAYRTASYLKLKTKNSDYLYVVGNLVAIYPLAERKPASENLLYKIAKERSDETADALVRNKPKYLVQETSFALFSPLDRLVKTSYNRFAQIENVTLYKLK